MRKITTIGMIIGLLIVSGLMGIQPQEVKGAETVKEDVYIDSDDWVDDMLWSDKGDEIRVKLSSTLPVDVYIIDGDNYNMFDLELSNLSRASLTRKDVTSLDIKWTQPDDKNYYLVIVNKNSETTVVNYSFTDVLGTKAEEAGEALGTVCLVFIIIGILIVVLIIVVIIIIWMKKGKK